MIDLTIYCDTERNDLKTPIDIGGGETVATNGKVMVIVPSTDGDGRREVPEKMDVISALLGRSNWDGSGIPIRSWNRVSNAEPGDCEACKGSGFMVKCRHCSGKGEAECDMGHMHDCDKCDSTGCSKTPSTKNAPDGIACYECYASGKSQARRVLVPIEVIPNVFLAQDELDKIVDLPNVVLVPGTNPKPLEPVAFRFDGGRGLIMPCRADRKGKNVIALDSAA